MWVRPQAWGTVALQLLAVKQSLLQECSFCSLNFWCRFPGACNTVLASSWHKACGVVCVLCMLLS